MEYYGKLCGYKRDVRWDKILDIIYMIIYIVE